MRRRRSARSRRRSNYNRKACIYDTWRAKRATPPPGAGAGQLEPPDGGFLGAIPTDFIAGARKYAAGAGIAHGQSLVWGGEDFGLQGEQPTHPELLDWRAGDFQENGWDLKALLRSMVLTKAFRQSSAWRAEIDDPENRLFARASSYRLDAEVLRDIGLWASGLLDRHMGGEGVKPYQPAGMWLALAHPGSNTKKYVADKGTPLYRRSLYVYWKRTSPHPMMTLFDAPDRESSCVRRSRTNTPLQS